MCVFVCVCVCACVHACYAYVCVVSNPCNVFLQEYVVVSRKGIGGTKKIQSGSVTAAMLVLIAVQFCFLFSMPVAKREVSLSAKLLGWVVSIKLKSPKVKEFWSNVLT